MTNDKASPLHKGNDRKNKNRERTISKVSFTLEKTSRRTRNTFSFISQKKTSEKKVSFIRKKPIIYNLEYLPQTERRVHWRAPPGRHDTGPCWRSSWRSCVRPSCPPPRPRSAPTLASPHQWWGYGWGLGRCHWSTSEIQRRQIVW